MTNGIFPLSELIALKDVTIEMIASTRAITPNTAAPIARGV